MNPAYRFLALACAVFALVGCGEKNAADAKGKAKAKAPAPVPVLVAKVEQKTVPFQLQAVGNVETLATVSIKSRVDGQILAVNLADGRDVAKGQTLFQIDPRPFEAMLKQAEATLLKDQAQLNYLRGQEQRYQDLLQKNFVSKEAYAQVRSNRDAAEAAVRAGQAAVESARLQLGYATIRAPISGRVGKIMVTEGNLVKANGDNPLVVINQMSPIYVSFAVPEQYGAQVRARLAQGRLPVRVLPRVPGAAPIEGRLAFVDNTVDAATGTLRLRAEFANADHRLWPGDFVQATLTLREDADAIVVPSAAIQNGPKGPYVFVAGADGTVSLRPVTPDRSAGTETIVARGLQVGERVVTDGASRLAPGARVQIREPSQAARAS